MPKKLAVKTTLSNNPSFRGFLNVNLPDDIKTFIKSQPFGLETFEKQLHISIEAGFKFTFSYDSYSKAFQCIGTRSDKEHEDFGILLTGRGSTPIKAFKQWCFISSEIIGDRTWSEMLTVRPEDELDD